VNNLLENLDGTAENVAEGVAEVTTGGVDVGQLLESSRQAVGLARGNNDDDDDHEDYDDDESYEDDSDVEEEGDYSGEYDEVTTDDDEDEFEDAVVEEEITVKEEEAIVNDSDHNFSATTDDYESEIAGITGSTRHRLETLQGGSGRATENIDAGEDAISIEGRRSVATVSELSFSEADLAGRDEETAALSRSRSRSPKSSPKRLGKQHPPHQPSSLLHTTAEIPEQPQRLAGQATPPKLTESLQSTTGVSNPPAVAMNADPTATKTETISALTKDEKSQSMAPASTRDTGIPPHPASAPVPRVPAAPRSKGASLNPSPASANNSTVNTSLNKKIQSLQAQLAKSQKELSAEQNQNAKLAQQLEVAEAEVEAQAKELQRAGEQLAQNRSKAQEDQDDLLDEHEEEMEELERKHKDEVDAMRADYEKTIAVWKQQFELEQAKRQQEGGDWTKELEESIQREKDAIKRLHDVTMEKAELQSKFDKITMHDSSLQDQLQAALLASKTAAEREQKAQTELDAAAELHGRQMAQRQRREAELEHTVLELGSALTLAKQQQQAQTAGQGSASADPSQQGSKVSLMQLKQEHNAELTRLKERSELLSEELETAQVSLTMETQRREALQQELAEIALEREEEASENQIRQQKHDRKVAELESMITRLQATIRTSSSSHDLPIGSRDSQGNDRNDDDNEAATSKTKQLQHQLDESKREINKLSEQLLRNQDMVESSKTEILALKGRLQSATTRAEEAEKALYSTTSNNSSTLGGPSGGDIESAGLSKKSPQPFSMRRRVKGGARGGAGIRPGSVRSIRSALQLGPGRDLNPAMDQIAHTIDSIDSWMIDTGSVLRYEPLARLGFFLYLVILHLWAFALVVFHTTEVPHGDFGSMDSNPQHWRTHT
jgi:hypothetical protein